MTEQHTPVDTARIGLAAELRRGMHLLVGREATIDQMDRIREAISPLFDELASAPVRKRETATWSRNVSDAPADGEVFPDSVFRPVSGSGNPFSIPMTVVRDGDSVVTTVVLDSGFEGAPGRSHGGFVSAIFDDLLGSLPMLKGKIAFTGSLTVDYLAPSPVHEPVTYRGWIDRIEGRKLFVLGEARHDDVVVSTASAVFIDATELIARMVGA